jgi:hypothetical protein
VQILHDHHRPAPLPGPVQGVDQGVEDGAPLPRGHPLAQGATDLTRDVVQRPERPRGQQRVTGAPEHLGAAPDGGGEGGGQTGLAGPGLPGEDSDPPAAGGVGQQRVQVGKGIAPLQELHRGSAY